MPETLCCLIVGWEMLCRLVVYSFSVIIVSYSCKHRNQTWQLQSACHHLVSLIPAAYYSAWTRPKNCVGQPHSRGHKSLCVRQLMMISLTFFFCLFTQKTLTMSATQSWSKFRAPIIWLLIIPSDGLNWRWWQEGLNVPFEKGVSRAQGAVCSFHPLLWLHAEVSVAGRMNKSTSCQEVTEQSKQWNRSTFVHSGR